VLLGSCRRIGLSLDLGAAGSFAIEVRLSLWHVKTSMVWHCLSSSVTLGFKWVCYLVCINSGFDEHGLEDL